MPRQPNLDPPVEVSLNIPSSLLGKIDLKLFSPLESRVPYGTRSRFIVQLIREHFTRVSLDLSPYTGELPGLSSVSGTPEAINLLRSLLERTAP